MSVSGLGFEATQRHGSRAGLDHTAFARGKTAQAFTTPGAAATLTSR
jgi:hypothetical protein